MMNTAHFLREYPIGFKAEQVSFRPGMDEWKGARHYLIYLGYEGRDFVTFYSQGSAIPPGPILRDVLECLQLDCQLGKMSQWQFIQDLGQSSEWRESKAIRTELRYLFGRAFRAFERINFNDYP